MRITKAELRIIRAELARSQAILCGMASRGELKDEDKRRHPYGECNDDNQFELLRQLMNEDLDKATRRFID